MAGVAHPRLEVGRAIGRAFSVWFASFVPFSILALLVHLPVLGLTIYRTTAEIDPAAGPGLASGATGLSWLLKFLLQATVVFGVFQHLQGRRPGLAASIAKGMGRLLPALLTGIAIALAAVIPAMAFGCVGGLAGMGLGPEAAPVLAGVLGGFGFMLVYVMLYVAIPVVVVENAGVGVSIQRSQALTSGNRTRLFGAVLLFTILQVAVVAAAAMLVSSMTESALAYELCTDGVAILVAPGEAILSAVVYHDLRVAKDGVNIEDLAKAFD